MSIVALLACVAVAACAVAPKIDHQDEAALLQSSAAQDKALHQASKLSAAAALIALAGIAGWMGAGHTHRVHHLRGYETTIAIRSPMSLSVNAARR
jgi:hypothetical protein